MPKFGRAETREAIEAAAAAFPAWRANREGTGGVLRRWFELIIGNQEDLARLMTLEQGKPLAESRGEVAYGASFIEWFAEEGKRTYGDTIPSHAARQAHRRHQGAHRRRRLHHAVELPDRDDHAQGRPGARRRLHDRSSSPPRRRRSPRSRSPCSPSAPACPAGVLNVVTGSAQRDRRRADLEPARPEDLVHRIDRGRQAPDGAVRGHRQEGSLELGGNAPFIVFDDADLDAAVEGAIVSKYRNTGQTCVCANRLLVQAVGLRRVRRAAGRAVDS